VNNCKKLACFFLAGLSITCSLNAQTQYGVSTFAGTVLPPPGVADTAISIGQPQHVILDPASNLYFSSNASVFRLDRAGNLTLFAGTGLPGCSGDDGAATAAQLTQPTGLAMDAGGNLFVADPGCQSIRMIDGNGIITTIAQGNGMTLTGLGGMTIDTSENLYVAESQIIVGYTSVASGHLPSYGGLSTVLKIALNGTVTTFAGEGAMGLGGDSGPATKALLSQPTDVGLDAFGNIYIADYLNARIRVVDPQGIITTFAGIGSTLPDGVTMEQDTGDGGLAATASISYPNSLTVGVGGIYIGTQFGLIRVVSPGQGIISTIAGSAKGAALAAGLPVSGVYIGAGLGASGLAVDGAGKIYAASNNAIWKLPPGGMVSDLAGNSFYSYSGDGGAASNAQFGQVVNLARDSSGGLLLADQSSNVIRRISPAGTVSTVAGTGAAASAAAPDGVQATQANLNQPSLVAADSAGNFYIAGPTFTTVRKVSPGGLLSTAAGNGTYGNLGDEGPANQAQLEQIVGLAVDSADNLYISTNNKGSGPAPLRKVTPDGIIHTVAQIASPGSICVDPAGNIYVVSYQSTNLNSGALTNPTIVMVTPGGTVTPFAGMGPSNPGDGGPALNATVTDVGQMVFDVAGNMYISDLDGIRAIDTSGVINTIAGTGQAGYAGDGGPALSAQTSGNSGIAVDTSGNVYFAEDFNPSAECCGSQSVIRLLQPQNVLPNIPNITGVVNGASFANGGLVPGEIATLFGTNLTSASGIHLVSALPLPTTFLNASLTINSLPVAIFAVDNVNGQQQINFQVPWEVTIGSNAMVTVGNNGSMSASASVPVLSAQPGIFTYNAGGNMFGAILHANFQLANSDNPANAGETVLIYCTGLGAVSTAPADGAAGSGEPTAGTPTVSIGGINAPVSFSGLAPGFVGLYQVNAAVPLTVATGNQSVVIALGGVSSNSVLLPVQ